MAATTGSQRNPPSVLASLMGLDEIVLQQPVKKQKSQRVLSENYLQRVSSIGFWGQRSFSKQHGLGGREKKRQQKRTGKGNSKLHLEFEGPVKQQLSKGCGPDELITGLDPQLGSKIQTCTLCSGPIAPKEKPEKVDNVALLSNVMQLPERVRKQNCERMGKHFHVGFAGGDKGMGRTQVDALSVSDCRSLNRDCILDYSTLNQSYPVGIGGGDGLTNMSVRNLATARLGYSAATESTETRTSSIYFHKYWCMNKRPSCSINLAKLRARKRSSSQEDGAEIKDSQFSCKMSQSISFLQSESSHSARNKSSIQDLMCNFKNRSREYVTVSIPSNYDAACPDSANSCTVQQAVLVQDVNIKNQNRCVEFSQTSNSSISSTGCDELAACLEASEKNIFMHESPKNHNWKLVSSDYKSDAEVVDSSSCVSQVSDQQEDSTSEVSEESSVASYYSSVDQDSLGNFDVCHSSPVSVLGAPFEGGISSFSEWFPDVNTDLHYKKLEVGVLESGSPVASSKWPGVIVSSDDEAEEERTGDPVDKELIKAFRVEESRDFSYMVDILIEAGFHEMSFGKWHPPDSPISPSVFDVLEKKYVDQTCWRRPERRLLFDRVNLALVKILQPWLGFPTWAKPAAGRLGVMQIEEEVWKFLANQEKEARTMTSSSEKILGADDGWLLLGNDIEVIAREMEASLVEDLVSDIVREEIS